MIHKTADQKLASIGGNTEDPRALKWSVHGMRFASRGRNLHQVVVVAMPFQEVDSHAIRSQACETVQLLGQRTAHEAGDTRWRGMGQERIRDEYHDRSNRRCGQSASQCPTMTPGCATLRS